MIKAFFLREIVFLVKPARLVWLVFVPVFTAFTALVLSHDAKTGIYASRGVLAIFAATAVLASLENDRKNSLVGLLDGRRRVVSLLAVKIICSLGGTFLFVLLLKASPYLNFFWWKPTLRDMLGVIYTSLVIAVTASWIYCLNHKTLYSISAAFMILLAGLYSVSVTPYNIILFMGGWLAASIAALVILSTRFNAGEEP